MKLPQGARLLCTEAAAPQKGSILICPGGGYEWLSPREAEPVANAYAAAGWKAYVLYYTVRKDGEPLGMLPMRQLSAAVAGVRAQSPAGLPVVVCGFSAGGHVAASLGVHAAKQGLARPDGMILCYPVITAGPFAHKDSFRRLAGEGDTAFFSLENQVDADTPPAFLWHTVADPSVPVQNSLLMAQALAAAGVPFELHLFPKGVHGLSLAVPEVDEPARGRLADPHVAEWFRLSLAWLDMLKKE